MADTSVVNETTYWYMVTATDTGGGESADSGEVLATPVASDTTPPVVTLAPPAEGATFDHNEVVLASYSCSDEVGGSGIDTCVGDVANGADIDTSTWGRILSW